MRNFLVLAVAFGLAAPATATTVLGFERVNAAYPSTNYAGILGFYAGGTSSQGTSGTNFGITFAANAVAVCLNAVGGSCSNASAGGLQPTSGQGALGIGSGTSTYFDIPAGFSNAIGFRYALRQGVATIAAYSGLGGTGTLLSAAPLPLFNIAAGCPAYNATECPFGPGGLSFSGTALSVVFTGVPGDVVWDDLTLGFNDPQSPPSVAIVPEPASWTLMVAGFGLAGSRLRRRRSGPRTQGDRPAAS